MAIDIQHESHYLHERMRKDKSEPHIDWVDRNADYDIRSGLILGQSETQTLTLQGWKAQK